jgi:hypothetical protein
MTAPLVRDHAGRFTPDHGPLPYTPAPRDGFHLRYDPDAERARRRLAEALAEFRPATPACCDAPDDWFGGGHSNRQSGACAARAVAACRVCPVRAPCAAAGRFESHGVWGGVDKDAPKREQREQYDVQRREGAA